MFSKIVLIVDLTSLRSRLILLFMIIALAGCEKGKQSLTLDKQAPELTVQSISGEMVRLKRYQGNVVFLSFWAKGCNSCAKEMVMYESIFQAYRDRGLVILAVNTGNDREFVQGFGRRLHLTFPLLLDSLLITSEKYRVSAMPTTYLLDRQGRLRDKIEGAISHDALEAKLLTLL